VITVDQYNQLLHELSDLRRQMGVTEREGTIHKVWAKNGEQKVQVQIGWKPSANGGAPEPLLTPYIGTGESRGPMREEMKYTKGMPVRVTSVGGDYRKARVIASQESQDHQRPQHATDYEVTAQYDQLRKTYGADFLEYWLSPKRTKKAQEQQSEEATAETSSQAQMTPEQKDDVTKAKVVFRLGRRQKNRKDKDEPWDGPGMVEDREAQPTVVVWAKRRSGSDQGPPEVETDEVHIQYGDKTKSVISDGKVVHSVGELNQSGELVDATKASITTILNDKITHQVTDQSITTILKDKITHQVENSVSTVKPGFITHIAPRVDIKGDEVYAMAETLLHTESRGIWKVTPSILHAPEWAKPTGPRFRADPPPDTYVTASLSTPTPPTDDISPGVPFNGMRWIDTTSGIEYAYYSGVWSEGGGDISFPSEPAVGDVFTQPRQPTDWSDWDSADDVTLTPNAAPGVNGEPNGAATLIEDTTLGPQREIYTAEIAKAAEAQLWSVSFPYKRVGPHARSMFFSFADTELLAGYAGVTINSDDTLTSWEDVGGFATLATSVTDIGDGWKRFNLLCSSNDTTTIYARAGLEANVQGDGESGYHLGELTITPPFPRQWQWNGRGWESTLTERAAAAETRVSATENRCTSLETRVDDVESRCTSLEDRVTDLETTIDGGTF
jgi:hypothetical protein